MRRNSSVVTFLSRVKNGLLHKASSRSRKIPTTRSSSMIFSWSRVQEEVERLIPIEKSCIFLDKILNGSSTFQPLQCPKEREHSFSHPVDRMLADSMVSFLASVCDR